MSTITTEDCKQYLVNYFKNNGTQTFIKDWKRLSKYKQGDVWMRDFSHPTLGIVYLAENNNLLDIVETKTKEDHTQVSYFKTFSNDDTNGAKKLVKKLIKIRSAHEDDDLVFESADWKKYSHALPSQFTFCFPFDNPHEIYNNDLKNVINGLDSPFTFNTYDSFNIMFNDRNTNDIDLYTSDCLNPNISGILPIWTDFIDEYHLEVTSEAPKELTVKQFIHMMFDLGFEYKVGSAYDCLFRQEIQAYISDIIQGVITTSKNLKV